MALIAHDSRSQRSHNEDFFFAAAPLPGVQIFAVGDFAHSEYTGLDKLAIKLLQQSIKAPGLSSVPIPVLIAQIASQLNNDLLNHHHAFKWLFQCCVTFAGISGATLSYLSIGDCRVAVRRDDMLFLLNGTVWVDTSGNLLPPVVTANQEMQRGAEPAPSQALGIRQELLLPSMVKEFLLEPDDLVLLYSDGVDKVLSPAHLLTMLGNGLKVPHPNKQQLDRIVSVVLEEVETHHGDDDRTLLIASGPHAPVESRFIKSESDRLTVAHGVMEGRMKELEDSLASINKSILEQLSEHSAKFGELKDVVNEIRQAQAGDSSAPTIARLGEIANELSKVSIDMQGLIVAAINQINLEAPREGYSYPDAPLPANGVSDLAQGVDTTPADTGVSDVQDPVSPPPSTIEAGVPQQIDVSQVPEQATTIDSFVDVEPELKGKASANEEGIICVQSEGLALFSRGYWLSKKKQSKSDFYIVPREEAPSGWITSLYLYLLNGPQQELRARTGELIAMGAAALTPVLESDPMVLRHFHEQHMQLRQQRENGAVQIKSSEQSLANQLYELLRTMQPALGDEPQQRSGTTILTGTGPGWFRRKTKELAQFLKSHPVVLPTFIITILIAAVICFLVYTFISQDATESRGNANVSNRNAVGAIEKKFQLLYAGDGRTLVVKEEKGKPVRLGLRVATGKEDEFFAKIKDETFGSKAEAEKWLTRPDLSTFIVERDSTRVPPPGQKFFPIIPADFPDVCNKFLDRVNRTLPDGVHNQFTDLTRLNPGLQCQDLQEGDELLVMTNRRNTNE